MTQTERDLSPHFIHPIDHDKEREIFEEEWGTDYHHPVTFAPAFHPKAKDPLTHAHPIHEEHQDQHVYEAHQIYSHPVQHHVAPQVQKHTPIEEWELDTHPGIHRPMPTIMQHEDPHDIHEVVHQSFPAVIDEPLILTPVP